MNKINFYLFQDYLQLGARINRFQYFFRTIIIYLIGGMTYPKFFLEGSRAPEGALFLLVVTILSLLMLVSSIKRLRDLNLRYWFVILLFVPIVTFVFYLYLIFAPGTKGVNKYGEPEKLK